jgi:hypothetical protein
MILDIHAKSEVVAPMVIDMYRLARAKDLDQPTKDLVRLHTLFLRLYLQKDLPTDLRSGFDLIRSRAFKHFKDSVWCFRDSTVCRIWTPYSQEFVSELKTTVPHANRTYEAQDFSWRVDPDFAPFLRVLANKHYPKSLFVSCDLTAHPFFFSVHHIKYKESPHGVTW